MYEHCYIFNILLPNKITKIMQHIEIKTRHTIVITKSNRPVCFALKINNDERKV